MIVKMAVICLKWMRETKIVGAVTLVARKMRTIVSHQTLKQGKGMAKLMGRPKVIREGIKKRAKS